MEFAVSAVVLIVLLLPGFILQTAYTRGFWRWNSPTSARSLTEQIPVGVVLASVLHGLWTSLCALMGRPIDFSAVMMLLLGSYGPYNIYFDRVISGLTRSPSRVFAYFSTLYLASAFLGYLFHWLVRRYALDRKSYFLRFNNPWFYLLTGEITEFGEVEEDYGEISAVYLTTIVHHTGKDYLYRGVVNDFFFDKAGNLDRVLLTLAVRRDLSDDREPDVEFSPDELDERYYDIEGDYLVLRYSEMSTLNVDYIFVTPADAEAT